MWEKDDELFINFWRLIPPIHPYAVIAIGGFILILGLIWACLLTFQDILSNEVHYAGWPCFLSVILALAGLLTALLGDVLLLRNRA